jgi:hypothetical protein
VELSDAAPTQHARGPGLNPQYLSKKKESKIKNKTTERKRGI